MDIGPFTSADDAAVDQLLDRCFGPARGRRTAALLRAGAARRADLSFVALDGDAIVGAVQVWPVALASPTGTHRLLLLGPLVSDPARRGQGIGSRLMRAALDAVGDAPVTLIGDASYYGRWGFEASRTLHWALPGPVERSRLLLRGGEALPLFGRLQPVGARSQDAAAVGDRPVAAAA